MRVLSLILSGLCLVGGIIVWMKVPADLRDETARLLAKERYFTAPTTPDGDCLLLRSDSYGKGYFGASRNGGRTHQGIDILAPLGSPILATKSGRVSVSLEEKGYGQYIEIIHPDGLKTRYAHLSRRFVGQGVWVGVGDIIGCCGKSGNAINPHIKAHLHFEIRDSQKALNPMSNLLDPDICVLTK